MTTAMLLCAGLGTRLRPLSDELAKPLMPIGDRPVLAHVLDSLRRGGIEDVVINTHHRSDDFDMQVHKMGSKLQVLHEIEILGTAGGVAHAAHALGEGDVVVWNGDIVATELDVRSLVRARLATGAALVWVTEPAVPGSGTVGLDDEGNVVRLRGEVFGREVSGGNFLGVQALSASMRDALPAKGCLVADVALPLLRRGGRIASLCYEGPWDDIGTASALLRANQRWLQQRGLPAWVAPGARVAGDVRLEGSVVGPGATVRGAGLLRDCVVFANAELTAPAERTLAAPRSHVALPLVG
jgi:mannose-1-phosphate guanylyltransferase